MIATPPAFSALVVPRDHPAALTFAFRGDEMLAAADGFALAGDEACRANGIAPESTVPVGLLAGVYCRAVALEREAAAAPGYAFRTLRSFFGTADDGLLAVAFRAKQVAEWARTHRFCGACGGPTARLSGERAMKCAACGHAAYPRVSPAMMVLVRRGPDILLARHARGPRWSALAGFLEAGESLEEAIHREVREEVGLEVKDLRYFASQSWPFPHSLMVAFTAEYAGGELRPDITEIAEARWHAPGDPLPELAPPQSVARALIDANLAR
jgi:NAD+ diphosphatase